MRYDTAGKQIIELIQNCDCGLTGGCKKCNPLLMKKETLAEKEIIWNREDSPETYQRKRTKNIKEIKHKTFTQKRL